MMVRNVSAVIDKANALIGNGSKQARSLHQKPALVPSKSLRTIRNLEQSSLDFMTAESITVILMKS